MNTVLITGASRGIGKAIATLLSEHGYKCLTPTRTELDIVDINSINSYLDTLSENIGLCWYKLFKIYR